MVANDNEPIPHTECREGRVETHEASLWESLSRLDLLIIALAGADSPASLFELSRLHRWYRVLVATRLPNRLANPRLEALRRFAILARYGLADDPGERMRIARAGFNMEQIELIAGRVAAFRNRPHGIFSTIAAWRFRVFGRLLSTKQAPDEDDVASANPDMGKPVNPDEQSNGDEGATARLGAGPNTDFSGRWVVSLRSGGDDHDLRAILTEFGQRLLTAITSPTLLPIYKAAVGDPGISPDSIKQFFDDGPRAVTDGLAHMLRSAATREEIFVNDCAIAAQQFVGMVRANIQLEVALGLRPAPPPDEIRHVVDQAVEIFLRGIQCKCPPPRPQAATVQRGRR